MIVLCACTLLCLYVCIFTDATKHGPCALPSTCWTTTRLSCARSISVGSSNYASHCWLPQGPRGNSWTLNKHMDVSENRGTPKSSILIRFSIINHPFWGIHIFWKHPYAWKEDVQNMNPGLYPFMFKDPYVCWHLSLDMDYISKSTSAIWKADLLYHHVFDLPWSQSNLSHVRWPTYWCMTFGRCPYRPHPTIGPGLQQVNRVETQGGPFMVGEFHEISWLVSKEHGRNFPKCVFFVGDFRLV